VFGGLKLLIIIAGEIMPIYEYICKDCGKRFEILRSIKEADSPVLCKICQSGKTARAVSVFFAQSNSRIIAGGNNGGCSGCSSGSCSTCGSN
jgi:putative FmdB family regulatory protein